MYYKFYDSTIFPAECDARLGAGVYFRWPCDHRLDDPSEMSYCWPFGWFDVLKAAITTRNTIAIPGWLLVLATSSRSQSVAQGGCPVYRMSWRSLQFNVSGAIVMRIHCRVKAARRLVSRSCKHHVIQSSQLVNEKSCNRVSVCVIYIYKTHIYVCFLFSSTIYYSLIHSTLEAYALISPRLPLIKRVLRNSTCRYRAAARYRLASHYWVDVRFPQ